jgi:hypothetical protein
MSGDKYPAVKQKWPTLALWPLPGKVLVSAIIFTLSVAMAGAAGQIIVHDIIPTFFSGPRSNPSGDSRNPKHQDSKDSERAFAGRGDLFSEIPTRTGGKPPFYQTEQFVWQLKWTHIHLFGMNMIFIFMGTITQFLNLSIKTRTWLIVLPFIGVLVDIAAIWLRAYISPAYFWLHIPGGGLFGSVFVIVAVRSFWEMFGVRKNHA